MEKDVVHRKTKQKSRILSCIMEWGKTQITAAQLINLAPEVGSATIYRYLKELEQEGILKKYTLPDGGGACYDYVGKDSPCREHYHLKCTGCGKVFHVYSEEISRFSMEMFRQIGFEIDTTKIVFYGLCGQCSEAEGRGIE